jgi:N6-L-threonylcarbamoyladenine synthase
MIVLGIESSCDDTAAAVVVDGREIRSNVASSQAEIHARYGGIVPEMASRSHVQQIVPIVRAALSAAEMTLQDVDVIAVTSGPGLAGSLIVGLNMAKGLAAASGKPLIGVNHLQGHAYAGWLYDPNSPNSGARGQSDEIPAAPEELCGFPLLCLVVSGGHTDLALIKSHGEFERIGRTRDDAAGEAFDKAARLMGLGYPGGPVIQKIAALGEASDPLPRAWIPGTWDFSFSGLKTAVLHRARTESGPAI